MKAVMYHYVRPGSDDVPGLKYLHLDDFKRQLDYFEEKYGFVKKDDFVSTFEKGATVPPGIVLTFDDSLSDHYGFVYPELKKRNLWGLFFVPSIPYRQGKMLDVHKIHYLIGRYRHDEIIACMNDHVKPEDLSKDLSEQFSNSYIHQETTESEIYIKQTFNYFIAPSRRSSLLDAVCAQFFDQADVSAKFYVSVDGLREMHVGGMMIGAHTFSHPVLAQLDEEHQHYELADSFNFAADITGNSGIACFCYPYGIKGSYNETTISHLNKLDCKFSFTVEKRDITGEDIQDRPQELPRYNCNTFPHGQVRILPKETVA